MVEAPAESLSPLVSKPDSGRLASLDAYRGFIMLAMASGGFGFAKVALKIPDDSRWSRLWNFLAYQFDHVPWTGCGFWDLIQPAFMFMVGVALPYSYAARRAKGDSTARIIAHAAVRSAILIALGIFLSSNGAKQTNFTFVNVLTQIGLGYMFLYLVLGRGVPVQLGTVAAILGGYWLAFALYPLPPDDFDWASVGIDDDWQPLRGFAAHWNKNYNFAATADLWFLNRFPRGESFRFNSGGYQTLNFVPSLATMIFGVMAGELLRSEREPRTKRNVLFAAGAACLAFGFAVDHTIWPTRLMTAAERAVEWATGPTGWVMDPEWTICPIVKRIWTPTWAVFSTGWTLWMLAAFYWIIEIEGLRRWSYPLVVIGTNSIAAYCMSQLLKPWVRNMLKTHVSQELFSGTFGPILDSVLFLVFLWLACWWMYRRKLFLKI
jgi:predicted acyltransferase